MSAWPSKEPELWVVLFCDLSPCLAGCSDVVIRDSETLGANDHSCSWNVTAYVRERTPFARSTEAQVDRFIIA